MILTQRESESHPPTVDDQERAGSGPTFSPVNLRIGLPKHGASPTAASCPAARLPGWTDSWRRGDRRTLPEGIAWPRASRIRRSGGADVFRYLASGIFRGIFGQIRLRSAVRPMFSAAESAESFQRNLRDGNAGEASRSPSDSAGLPVEDFQRTV